MLRDGRLGKLEDTDYISADTPLMLRQQAQNAYPCGMGQRTPEGRDFAFQFWIGVARRRKIPAFVMGGFLAHDLPRLRFAKPDDTRRTGAAQGISGSRECTAFDEGSTPTTHRTEICNSPPKQYALADTSANPARE